MKRANKRGRKSITGKKITRNARRAARRNYEEDIIVRGERVEYPGGERGEEQDNGGEK